MKIVRADLFLVAVPMVGEFRSATSSTGRVVHLLLRVIDEDGGEGWGEAPTPEDPYYVGETPESVWQITEKYLAPILVGCELHHPADLSFKMGCIEGNPLARSGAEAAAWDLWCRRQGVSLAESLGSARKAVPAGATIGILADVGELHNRVAGCLEAGYVRLKMKIAPGWDLEPLDAVRSTYPGLSLVADANGSYHPGEADHIARLMQIDTLGLLALEQPFSGDEILAHARLQERMVTAVALDETIVSVGVLEAAASVGACRAVSLKVPRLGGISATLNALTLCREQGLDAWCGGMHELGIGRALNVALASLDGFTMPGDLAASGFYFDDDLIAEPFEVRGGNLGLPSGAGLGIEVNVAAVEGACLRKASVG